MRHKVILVLLLLMLFGSAAADAAPSRHVLFLFAQTEEFPAHKLFESGFKKQFQSTGEAKVEYSYDYLELTKFSANPRYTEQLATFYKQKYALKQPDIVVTHLGPAADFALKYGRDLFPGAQFMLATDEAEGLSNQDLPPGFGGVSGIFNVNHTIGLILQLQPDVRKIYVVIGDSERERQTMVAFRREVAPYATKVEFVYLNEMSLPRMVETVGQVREQAAVIYLHVFKDAAGNIFIPANEVKTFSEAAKVPMYVPYAVFMGRGAVGGYLMSTEILGMKAAELSLARLQAGGGPAKSVQVANAEYQFDWRALQRWGLSDSKLPPGSKVFFKEPTLWEMHQKEFVVGILVVVFLAILVIALLVSRSRLVKAEIELIRLNAELEDLYNNAPCGYHSFDGDGTITRINDTELGWLGYTREEVVGRIKCTDFLAPDMLPIYRRVLESVAAGDNPAGVECEVVNRGDISRIMLVNFSALRDSSGALIEVRCSMFDITDRKQIERALLEREIRLGVTNQELERAIRVKDEFLATMSHELRTPLTAVIGLSEVLREHIFGKMNDEQFDAVGTIEQSGRHLLSLINDILDLSKLDAGQVELEMVVCSAEEICQSSLQFIKTQAHKKNITVQFESEPPDFRLQSDPRRLKQMLINLLSNAVKFTPEDGKVGLSVLADESSDMLRFTVWDTGIGIREEDLPKLFQPFVQIDSGLARRHEGTGLGLVLVRQTARLHGGDVTVKSVPGEGSRFTIWLPWVR